MMIQEMMQAAFKAGYEPREVMQVAGATRQQVNAFLEDIRQSAREINRRHGLDILPIYANI